MTLKPLHDKILIRPEKNAERTVSGLHLAEHRKPETAGVVVAVGPCEHPLKAEAERLAGWLDDQGDSHREAAALLRMATQYEPQVRVGDHVVFSWESGQEIYLEDDDERYLLMRERDILAVLEMEAV